MSIWFKPIDLTLVNQRGENTMLSFLDIVFSEITDDTLTATMPITAKVKQPIGIMHGGASCVLAETVGSTAANFCVDWDRFYCVGLDINTNHIRAIREGIVTGVAKPFHLGRTTQVWEIKIHNEAQQLISINRLTMAVLEKK